MQARQCAQQELFSTIDPESFIAEDHLLLRAFSALTSITLNHPAIILVVIIAGIRLVLTRNSPGSIRFGLNFYT